MKKKSIVFLCSMLMVMLCLSGCGLFALRQESDVNDVIYDYDDDYDYDDSDYDYDDSDYDYDDNDYDYDDTDYDYDDSTDNAGLGEYSTLEEYYDLPAVNEAVEQEIANLLVQYQDTYSNITYDVVENTLYWDYFYCDNLSVDVQMLDTNFNQPDAQQNFQRLLNQIETETGIRPDAIVYTYYNYSGDVLYEGTIR